MKKHFTAVVFGTTIGRLGILASSRGIHTVLLPGTPGEEAIDSWQKEEDHDILSLYLKDLIRRLKSYLCGNRETFPDRLDFSGATHFQRSVWQAARLITYGETRSYGWLAGYINRPMAARAVGQALSKNRLPIVVPCHRIINSSGAIGGFNGGAGLKARLLQTERKSLS